MVKYDVKMKYYKQIEYGGKMVECEKNELSERLLSGCERIKEIRDVMKLTLSHGEREVSSNIILISAGRNTYAINKGYGGITEKVEIEFAESDPFGNVYRKEKFTLTSNDDVVKVNLH